MNSAYDSKEEFAGHKHPKLKGYILSAIDMEDDFTKSVYQDYMKLSNWPAGLSEKTIKNIKSYLQILLDDTQKHKKRFLELKRKLGS